MHHEKLKNTEKMSKGWSGKACTFNQGLRLSSANEGLSFLEKLECISGYSF
jgi:hypothetical protein